jgi:hypothetical protein
MLSAGESLLDGTSNPARVASGFSGGKRSLDDVPRLHAEAEEQAEPLERWAETKAGYEHAKGG